MLAFSDSSMVPPGGFRYKQPESGLILTAGSLLNLVEAVRKHRIANHYPITPTFASEVEHGACREVSAACQEVHSSKAAKMLGVQDVLRLTALIGESMVRGRPTVEPEEAEARAATCVGCKDNLEPIGCGPCQSKAMEAIIGGLIGSKNTSRDLELKACRHCGCLNKAQIWVPIDILHRHSAVDSLESLPVHCWKRPIKK